MAKISKIFWLGFYYGFARYLPASSTSFGAQARKVRRFICSRIFLNSGVGINVEKGAFFGRGGGISIGDNSGLGVNATILGPLFLGCDVMMGQDVLILTNNHQISDISIPMARQGLTSVEPVHVEDDVWIGSRVIILPGVRIGRGAVVGAGSVVTKNVAPYSIVAGNPARLIRWRDGRG